MISIGRFTDRLRLTERLAMRPLHLSNATLGLGCTSRRFLHSLYQRASKIFVNARGVRLTTYTRGLIPLFTCSRAHNLTRNPIAELSHACTALNCS